MIFRKRNIIAFVLILSFLGSPLTYTTLASDWFAAMKFGLDIAAKAAAQTAFKILSNRVLNKIKDGGSGGKAAFVQNWINFQTQSQYQGEGIFRAMLGNAGLCEYFGDDLKNLFGARATSLPGQNTRVGNLDPFALRAKCTLPSTFDMAKYQTDFAGNGGWEAWDRLLQPQNNYYGSLFQSLDEVARQRDLSERSATNQVLGHGFTGLQDGCKKIGLGNNCLVQNNIKTPGEVLSLSVANVLDGNVKFFTTADAASMVISALVGFATQKLFDLAGSDNSDNGTNLRDDDSYKNEFCTAKDDMSFEAYNYASRGCPDASTGELTCSTALEDFPTTPGNGSYCERYRSDDNNFPFDRCVQACFKAVGILPTEVTRPEFSETPPPIPPEGGGAPAPDDADTKHGNHTSEVAEAKAELIAEGREYPDPNATDECYRFEIVERAVPKIGDGAGFLDKPGGNNCRGFAVDIIAFPDGYIYDVLVGSGDGSMPAWQPVGCGPENGDGTCEERYRSP